MSPRLVITDAAPAPILLSVYQGAECVSVPVAPTRALALARDLIAAAETRLKPTDAHHQPQEASQ